MGAILLAFLTGAALVAAVAWRNARAARGLDGEIAPEAPPASTIAAGGGLLSVGAAVIAAMKRAEPQARRGLVRLEIAVQPDMVLRLDGTMFGRVLDDMLAVAIQVAPCGRVLLTARRHGGRVEVAVASDGAPPGRDRLMADLRAATELLALHGGTLDVQAIQGAGTIVTARVLEPQGAGPMPLADVPTVGTASAATAAGIPAAERGSRPLRVSVGLPN